jgi:hypothetical protein
MVHVSTPALCLVLLSPLLAGFPTSNPFQDTSGPTKIELLAAGQGQSDSTSEAVTTPAKLTNADSANNITESYGSSTSAKVNVLFEGKRLIFFIKIILCLVTF